LVLVSVIRIVPFKLFKWFEVQAFLAGFTFAKN
jgi:hypothetical protein